MPKFEPSIPKGKVRKRLASQGRMLSLKIKRSMSSQEIRNKILKTFNISTYTVLACDRTGHVLLKSGDQDLDGVAAIDRRGCLYLCETFEVHHNFQISKLRYRLLCMQEPDLTIKASTSYSPTMVCSRSSLSLIIPRSPRG